MSKLYKRYEELKAKDNSKIYLFEVGVFYLLLDEDALLVSEILNLKITKLNEMVSKCGFPKNSLDKYLHQLDELGINYEVINNVKSKEFNIEDIVKKIRKMDINNLTSMKAFHIVEELYSIINEDDRTE